MPTVKQHAAQSTNAAARMAQPFRRMVFFPLFIPDNHIDKSGGTPRKDGPPPVTFSYLPLPPPLEPLPEPLPPPLFELPFPEPEPPAVPLSKPPPPPLPPLPPPEVVEPVLGPDATE